MADKSPKIDPRMIGNPGLRQFGGYIHEELLPQLSGMNGRRVMREMSDNSYAVAAPLFAFEMLLRRAPWNVQEADESPAALDAKAFVEEVMGDMARPWGDVIAEACTMLVFGFAPMEMAFKVRGGPDAREYWKKSQYKDGKIGLLALDLRAQETVHKWEYWHASDPEVVAGERRPGELKGMWQMPWDGPMVMIPIEKLLLFRTTAAKNNPEGRSVLRTAYRAWFFMKRLEEIEGIGIERDLTGYPVVRLPSSYMSPEADPMDKAVFEAYKAMVKGVRRDTQEGVAMPSDRDANGNRLFEFDLMTSGGARALDISKSIDRYAKAIAMCVLADFIYLGQGSVGSFALSSDKTNLFVAAIGAILDGMQDVFNRYLLPELWRLNGMPHETMPRLVHGDVETPNLGELGEYIRTLSGAGMTLFPDRDLENQLRAFGGLPPAPDEGDEDYMEDVPPPGAGAKPGKPEGAKEVGEPEEPEEPAAKA